MRTLVLVRHGRTPWNVDRRFRGRTDLPLDATGEAQAEAAAAFVAGRYPPRAIVSSPLRRARDTAAPLARTAGVEPAVHPGLVAMSFGSWEGLNGSDIAARWPEPYRAWLDAPARVRPPGGETLAEVQQRAVRAVEDALAGAPAAAPGPDGEGTLVVVAHTVVNRTIALHLLGLELDRFWSLDQRPGSVSVLRTGRRGRRGWSVELWNGTLHLGPHADDGSHDA